MSQMSQAPLQSLEGLIQRLDEAMDADCDANRCDRIKDALVAATTSGHDFLDEETKRPVPDSYARRLVHKDPQDRYSVVAMIWGEGQKTPLHDHAGTWCVECVYEGRIEVTSFSRAANVCSTTGVYDFKEEERIVAGQGDAGALIPPFEYHIIANADATTSVTLHVYGGEILECSLYLPREQGGYQAETRQLGYTA